MEKKYFIAPLNKIRRAVELGFEYDADDMFVEVVDLAEDYIRHHAKVSGYEHCELYCDGNLGQSYIDPNGDTHSDIEGWMNFQNTTGKFYHHFKDEKSFEEPPVALYEIPDEKKGEYAFTFADFINDNGDYIMLYDFLK